MAPVDTRVCEPTTPVAADGRSPSVDAPGPASDGVRPERRARTLLTWALLALPVVVLVVMAWRHRWNADDAFIDFRIVRQFEHGHGPVFNAGDRVEAGTSPLWLAILYVGDVLLPLRLEWIAVIFGIAASAGGLALGIAGTARVLTRVHRVPGPLLPLGALVFAVLPVAWDFATSGLESGLAILWLGACWWALCRCVVRQDTAAPVPPSWWVPVLLGLGSLVRPDLAVFSVAFVVAAVVVGAPRWRAAARVVVLAAVVPLVAELARAAYFGVLVPNTAIAKEASLTNWTQGWAYLRDLAGPYLLLVPLVLLACLVPRRARGDDPRAARFAWVSAIVVAGALVHGLGIVRLGGDFMHGRMLLPTAFALTLPVAVVTVSGAVRTALAAGVVVWIVTCALWLRPPYSHLVHAAAGAAPSDPFDPRSGIMDERIYWAQQAGVANPVTIDDYRNAPQVRAARATRAAMALGEGGLLLDALRHPAAFVPMRRSAPTRTVAMAPALGLYGYAVGDAVTVVDDHGLVSAAAAHQELRTRGRPGHEKQLAGAWWIALYGDPSAPLPRGVSATAVRDARRAVTCGSLRDLITSTTRPLDVASLWDDVVGAVGRTTFRFPADPRAAARACTTG